MPIIHHFHDCTALLVWRFVVVNWRYIKYEALPFLKSLKCSNALGYRNFGVEEYDGDVKFPQDGKIWKNRRWSLLASLSNFSKFYS